MQSLEWGIYDLNGNLVFNADSISEVKYAVKTKVSNFPVEKGTFATYNKVQEPDSVKLKLLASGAAKVSPLIAKLKQETVSPNLYNIVTPLNIYANMTLENFNYSQTSTKGLELLSIDASFLEVREVNPTFTNVKIPAPKKATAKSKETEGKKQTSNPRKTELLKGTLKNADAAAHRLVYGD